MTDLTQLCKDLEHYETPEWAVKAILQKEILTPFVVDPCCGAGALVWPLEVAGYKVFMNPPFSKADAFVQSSIERGARKIVCFQRFAWWESAGRKDFWDKYPPQRVYICGDRATCWRHDLPKDEQGNRYDHDGKRLAGSSTAHAWFVWEQGQGQGTTLHRLYKGDV